MAKLIGLARMAVSAFPLLAALSLLFPSWAPAQERLSIAPPSRRTQSPPQGPLGEPEKCNAPRLVSFEFTDRPEHKNVDRVAVRLEMPKVKLGSTQEYAVKSLDVHLRQRQSIVGFKQTATGWHVCDQFKGPWPLEGDPEKCPLLTETPYLIYDLQAESGAKARVEASYAMVVDGVLRICAAELRPEAKYEDLQEPMSDSVREKKSFALNCEKNRIEISTKKLHSEMDQIHLVAYEGEKGGTFAQPFGQLYANYPKGFRDLANSPNEIYTAKSSVPRVEKGKSLLGTCQELKEAGSLPQAGGGAHLPKGKSGVVD